MRKAELTQINKIIEECLQNNNSKPFGNNIKLMKEDNTGTQLPYESMDTSSLTAKSRKKY
ncbi:hypothetical protein DPMN_187162 [Dreissena polymorpha]|uniref:Uncharacterized protein n=1 Tax=Dreissena polymorpha TaxID=45954 RepID=A0A9D4DNJ7_DREPO|nr:hypothetical protein DPMN_187162 [Dreissena polymorpha]